MNKVWDVTPAKGLMRYVARIKYGLLGIITANDRRIPVTFVDSESPLGTQDGSFYSIVPEDDGDTSDEDGQHGRNAK